MEADQQVTDQPREESPNRLPAVNIEVTFILLTGTDTILYSKETAHRKSENPTVITTEKSVAMHFGKHHEEDLQIR